jgi:hypothetical protein
MGRSRAASSRPGERCRNHCGYLVVFDRSRYRRRKRRVRPALSVERRVRGAVCEGKACATCVQSPFQGLIFSFARVRSRNPQGNGFGAAVSERQHALPQRGSGSNLHRVPSERTRGCIARREIRRAGRGHSGGRTLGRQFSPAMFGGLHRSRRSVVFAQRQAVSGGRPGGSGLRTLSRRSDRRAVPLRVGQGARGARFPVRHRSGLRIWDKFSGANAGRGQVRQPRLLNIQRSAPWPCGPPKGMKACWSASSREPQSSKRPVPSAPPVRAGSGGCT